VHRDLKPENFLLQDASPDSPIKIADFGFACNVESEHRRLSQKFAVSGLYLVKILEH